MIVLDILMAVFLWGWLITRWIGLRGERPEVIWWALSTGCLTLATVDAVLDIPKAIAGGHTLWAMAELSWIVLWALHGRVLLDELLRQYVDTDDESVD